MTFLQKKIQNKNHNCWNKKSDKDMRKSEREREEWKERKWMECSSMASIAPFGPGDPGSNPGWFAVLNSNKKLSFPQ